MPVTDHPTRAAAVAAVAPAASAVTATATVAAVVVAWRPDAARLHALVRTLAAQVDHVLIVDNADDPAFARVVRDAANTEKAQWIPVGRNAGIGAAQNLGVARARALGARFVLLSDDDSSPPAGLVAALLDGFARARASGAKVAAVAPFAYDAREPDSLLVFADTRFGPRRADRVGSVAAPASPPARSRSPARAPSQSPTPFPAAFLLASGCLIDLDAWAAIGPMREDFFIDHVDLEWGLRARRAGWHLFALPDVPLAHRLGETVVRPWLLRGRPIHLHAPARNYYLVRNTVLLMRSGLMSAGWRAGYLAWLTKYAAYNACFVKPRLGRALLMLSGLRDGLAGRTGPMPPRPPR